MGKHWRNLIYILRHKYLVYVEGRKLGLGRWRLIKHDLSKFSRAEWRAYAEKFHSGEIFVYNVIAEQRERAFREAWQHHWISNPHHWEHWSVDPFAVPFFMPLADTLEMIADWRAMARANGRAAFDWYAENKYRIRLHPTTRMMVERELYSLPPVRKAA